MPKAASNTATLRRNQACRNCRKKKLKCDAARPHCGTCVKNWKARISVPAPLGYVHDLEPDCVYDPAEGVSLVPVTADDPAEKVKLLESQLAELKGQLHKAHRDQSRSASPNALHHTAALLPSPSVSPHLGAHGNDGHGSTLHEIVTSFNGDGYSQFPPGEGSGLMHVIEPTPIDASQGLPHGAVSQLLYSGWNQDLPDPATVHHLIDVFFNSDPCGSRVIHRPSFMASLSLPPHHAEHPHPALLHAICATASRWVSRDIVNAPDGQRRDKFADFHARKARSYIDQTMTSGDRIFSVLQACILLSWYFYMEGRWVEIWIFAGFQTRVAVPMRLNYPGTHMSDDRGVGSYLPPPVTVRDLECRRRAWWMAIMFDRIVSIGGWLHGIDVQDIGTEFPLRAIDFEMELDVPNNPQHLWTDGVLTIHPPEYTDAFILLIKATMLFGRVTDFNVRSTLHTGGAERSADITRSKLFLHLDGLVTHDFIESLPPRFRNPLGVGEQPDGTQVDTDLYLVHLLPHAATITLHDAHSDMLDPSNISANRCLMAAQAILANYHLITSTSFDISRLHPTVVMCWYLAAVVQVHLCKCLIVRGDRQGEATVWGEINQLRLAMLEYGAMSPIGVRQEKLLQGILTDILHMTSTHNPLSVRMPLYPFSHTRVFQNASLDTQQDGAPVGSHIAPLPSPRFDEAVPWQDEDENSQNMSY